MFFWKVKPDFFALRFLTLDRNGVALLLFCLPETMGKPLWLTGII